MDWLVWVFLDRYNVGGVLVVLVVVVLGLGGGLLDLRNGGGGCRMI